jgi:hypothetical protein
MRFLKKKLETKRHGEKRSMTKRIKKKRVAGGQKSSAERFTDEKVF